MFKDQSNLTQSKTWHINHVLVYGNSKEIIGKNDDRYRALIDARLNGIKYVTYSRVLEQLVPKYPLMTIMLKAMSNQYEAIGMIPYRNYELDEWLNYHLIQGKQELVKKDRFLSDAEKTELNARIDKLDQMTSEEIWDEDDLTTTTFSNDGN